jgi:curli production assembly/transport component CsgF
MLSRVVAAALAVALISLGAASDASAQEMVYRPVNPSFGGNPFNSDHLLGIATAQRPERDSAAGRQLSETERFAQQIQSRILSSLSSSLVEAITGADPGTSGEFTVGDQSIFFERTLTEIRLRITDANTGEVTEIVVPVLDFSNGAGAPSGQALGAPASADRSLLSAASPTSGALVDGGKPAGELSGSAPLDTPLEPTRRLDGGLGF